MKNIGVFAKGQDAAADACFQICKKTKGCKYFSTGVGVICPASGCSCFVYKTCPAGGVDAETAGKVALRKTYKIYHMASSDPGPAPKKTVKPKPRPPPKKKTSDLQKIGGAAEKAAREVAAAAWYAIHECTDKCDSGFECKVRNSSTRGPPRRDHSWCPPYGEEFAPVPFGTAFYLHTAAIELQRPSPRPRHLLLQSMLLLLQLAATLLRRSTVPSAGTVLRRRVLSMDKKLPPPHTICSRSLLVRGKSTGHVR